MLQKMIAAMAVSVALFATPALADKALRFAHVYEDSTTYHQAALRAAEAIKKGTEGRYTVDVFPSSSLGNEEALNDGLSLGTVDIIYTGPAFLAQTSRNIAIADYPYVFRDFAHWDAFWKSDLMKEMAEQYKNDSGNELVAATYYGSRHLSANKPILKPEDMKGLKIRVPNAPSYILFPKAAGANPTPMALAEVYLGLQQGTVDAQENPLPTIRSAQFHEVQKHISLNGHMVATLNTIISGPTLADMSPEDHKVIVEALQEAAAWGTDEVRGQEDGLVQFFRDAGVTVHEVDRQPFIDLVKPLLVSEDMPWDKGTYERLQAVGQ